MPLLEHVTLPRTGALDVVMKVLGPDSQLEEANKIERIVDMTIAYHIYYDIQVFARP